MFQKLDTLWFQAKARVQAFLTDEKGDVNIVSMVVLIGIAVLLAIVFREAISNLIKSLLNTISGNATNAVNERCRSVFCELPDKDQPGSPACYGLRRDCGFCCGPYPCGIGAEKHTRKCNGYINEKTFKK